MNDTLPADGFDTASGTGAYDGGGLGSPASQTPLPYGLTSNSPLGQARILATLKPQGANAGDRITAGLGAKTSNIPKKPVAAALSGFLDGYAGANGADAAKAKNQNESLKERFGVLKQLFDMDQKLSDSADKRAQVQSSIDATNKRTAAYEKSVTKKADAEEADPAADLAKVNRSLAGHPAAIALKNDANAIGSAKLAPEQRAALQQQLEADRQKLMGAYPSLKGIGAMPAAPAAAPAAGTPAPGAAAPQPASAPAGAPQSQGGIIQSILGALGWGGGSKPAPAPAAPAQNGVSPSGAPVRQVPIAPPAQAAPQVAPNTVDPDTPDEDPNAAPAAAPMPPSRAQGQSDIIAQAKAALASGKDPDAVRGLLQQNFGIDPSVLDE